VQRRQRVLLKLRNVELAHRCARWCQLQIADNLIDFQLQFMILYDTISGARIRFQVKGEPP
jgi:hypothetical protein